MVLASRDLAAAYANVFESHGAKANRVQQILSVHDERATERLFDAIEIEAAKFRPAGTDDQGIDALSGGIRRFAVEHAPVQLEPCVGEGDGIVRPHPRTLRHQ